MTAHLRQMMTSYEGPAHTVVGISLQNGQSQTIGLGPKATDAAYQDLIFEIGSITKVFTALLLCLLVEEGQIDPHAPLYEMSTDLSDVPSWITPQSLTSHTSGLPRLHVSLWQALRNPLPQDPYAGFFRADLLTWLRNWSGTRPALRPRHLYSNLGVGLLGEAMAMQQGIPFTDLLDQKLLRPLGLQDTGTRLSDSQSRRFVSPRNTKGVPVSPWTFQAMAGAGCLRSSAADLARFAALVLQALAAPQSPLERAICRSVRPVSGLGFRGSMATAAQCSGWFATKRNRHAPRILHHDGATAGATCAIYLCPETAQALAILSNNGIAANLWASGKLSWSNQIAQAQDYFAAPAPAAQPAP